ncbi:hypothetical protein AA0313_0633 [Acetobacter indonesiensis NRIC 0313]|uniref:Lipoprotein n=1 Tax=Acetobacter indonesiensis TaxID=104101 RepID=A0A6N3SZK0_9PROT|nr:Ig-like domain-containing protein [Acetobacter indonesiensis]MCG0993956.1 hypothetical protein [Acetobacter indonesiensis]MCI1436948.1 hypothetical protein [Acetobacter indonesiensis]MCI1545672.1 hypothetical protein [Acetobacter indonesiensis]MCI1765164.1 hypothetical protein [Acetobacter indonesiensis]MCP1231591.1 hypothetical protein [Acetobacter indonesiensis]
MRLQGIAVLALTGGMLAGCATTSGPIQTGSPNPFGYMKKSAVCSTTPVKAGANGQLATTMTVRSDDGLCELKISQPSGKSYASFGVTPAPEHGKAFLYNLDNDTHVTYTPTMGYAGTDTFTVILVPGPGEKRTNLTVTAQVDATGVVLPKAVVPAVTAPTTTKKAATTTRRRVVAKKKK